MACFITWTILFEKPSFRYPQKISVQCIRKPEVFWKKPVRNGSRKKSTREKVLPGSKPNPIPNLTLTLSLTSHWGLLSETNGMKLPNNFFLNQPFSGTVKNLSEAVTGGVLQKRCSLKFRSIHRKTLLFY